MVWSNAISMTNIEQQRRDAVNELRRAHDDLELRVLERTEELARSIDRLPQNSDQDRFLADAMPQIVWTTKPNGNTNFGTDSDANGNINADKYTGSNESADND